MQMPFGKYKHYELCDLDDGYLHWLLTEFPGDLHGPLKQALIDEASARGFDYMDEVEKPNRPKSASHRYRRNSPPPLPANDPLPFPPPDSPLTTDDKKILLDILNAGYRNLRGTPYGMEPDPDVIQRLDSVMAKLHKALM